jgi:hypothetical protein
MRGLDPVQRNALSAQLAAGFLSKVTAQLLIDAVDDDAADLGALFHQLAVRQADARDHLLDPQLVAVGDEQDRRIDVAGDIEVEVRLERREVA